MICFRLNYILIPKFTDYQNNFKYVGVKYIDNIKTRIKNSLMSYNLDNLYHIVFKVISSHA